MAKGTEKLEELMRLADLNLPHAQQEDKSPLPTAKRKMGHTQGKIGGFWADVIDGSNRTNPEERKSSVLAHLLDFDVSQLPADKAEEYQRILLMAQNGDWGSADFLKQLGDAERKFIQS